LEEGQNTVTSKREEGWDLTPRGLGEVNKMELARKTKTTDNTQVKATTIPRHRTFQKPETAKNCPRDSGKDGGEKSSDHHVQITDDHFGERETGTKWL